MIRHYIVAALRNMAANWLLTAIAILGLALGITASLLMALVIRNQVGFDHFIPGYERTYVAATDVPVPSGPDFLEPHTHRLFAALLKLNIPQIEASTRLMLTENINGGPVVMKRGPVQGTEAIYWADSNVFDVLPLPVLHGDLATALRRPDGIVLPRTSAEKYFGRDDPVGQSIDVSGHPMIVRAVIEDLPANGTELKSGIFASINAPFLGFANYKPGPPGEGFSPADIGVYTYLRLKPGASLAAVRDRAAKLVAPIYDGFTMPLFRLDRINLVEAINPGIAARLTLDVAVALLTLFIAGVNFVNLLTARASLRAPEVGVRKAAGADRRSLIVQFLGEALIMTLIAGFIAVVLAELALPAVNGLLGTGAQFDYRRDPTLLLWVLLGALLVGGLAGAYPAFVLSAFRPATVLKGWAGGATGKSILRNILVMAQFTILIGMVIAASVVWQQRAYALTTALHLNIDQILMVRVPNAECPRTFMAEIRKLPGVRATACTGAEFLQNGGATGTRGLRFPKNGGYVHVDWADADWGAFALYGIRPVAGSLATRSPTDDYDPSAAPGLVINQAAVKRFGFASAEAAIGQAPIPLKIESGRRIVAVVPDFAFHTVERAIQPTVFTGFQDIGASGSLVNVKLAGQQIPETLVAIDRLWSATGNIAPIDRFFLDDHMQQQYLSLLREAQIFAIFSAVAIFLACLGLFGMSLFNAERRTKEIGIRKAMGAETDDIIRLLLWQFLQPVLWANVIAWPLTWWAMTRWLSGFAYHVELQVWLFVAASAAAIIIALTTVAAQAFAVARQKPVLALRYE